MLYFSWHLIQEFSGVSTTLHQLVSRMTDLRRDQFSEGSRRRKRRRVRVGERMAIIMEP